MPKVLKSCVKQVMAKGHDESSAYGICISSLKKAGRISYDKDKGDWVDNGKEESLHLDMSIFDEHIYEQAMDDFGFLGINEESTPSVYSNAISTYLTGAFSMDKIDYTRKMNDGEISKLAKEVESHMVKYYKPDHAESLIKTWKETLPKQWKKKPANPHARNLQDNVLRVLEKL